MTNERFFPTVDIAVLRPPESGKYLLHTNGYLDPGLAEGRPGDACPRLRAARRLYRERAPTSAEEMSAILSDHTGGICVHRPDTHARTIVSFVAEVRAGHIHVSRGNPCAAPAQTHLLE